MPPARESPPRCTSPRRSTRTSPSGPEDRAAILHGRSPTTPSTSSPRRYGASANIGSRPGSYRSHARSFSRLRTARSPRSALRCARLRLLRANGEGPATLAEVTHRFFPGIPVVPYMSNFTTDSRYLRAAGILAYGFSGMALTREDDRRAHAADERIPVDAVRRAVEMAYALVLALAATE